MKTTQNLAVRAEMAVASGATSLNGPLSGITMTAPPAWIPMRVTVRDRVGPNPSPDQVVEPEEQQRRALRLL